MCAFPFLYMTVKLPSFTCFYVQDDMLFSQDFLTYMQAAAPLLDKDPSIWCISSWNDNSLSHLDWQNEKLVSFTPFLLLSPMSHSKGQSSGQLLAVQDVIFPWLGVDASEAAVG